MILYKRFTSILAFFCIVFISFSSYASVSSLQNNLELITEKLSPDVGIAVKSLDRKDILYAKNAKKPLNPASTTKLVTAAAALKYLGSDYRFHTKFYVTPKDDLFIEGSGDPSLVIENLMMIADQLAISGIKDVRHVIVNDSYFKSYTQPGLPPEKRSYNSYTGALSLNFNRVRIRVKPGPRIGKDAEVKLDCGKNVTIPFENEVETVRRGLRSKVELIPPPTKDGKEIFTVKGRVPISSKGFTVEKHVSLPPLYFAETLKTLLQRKGMNIRGEILTGPKARGSKLVYDHKSKPLSLIVKDMNKFSNNFIAEQLVKVLGAEFLKPPGSTLKGMTVLKKYLTTLGISRHNFILVNGSGLTYDNRMTANQLVKIFQDMYKDKRSWIAFYDSMPIWGRDGTLRRRKNSAILRDRARGKTGSLDFVKTIAGVVPSADNELIAYAILLNGGANMAGCRGTQTKIVEEVAKFRR